MAFQERRQRKRSTVFYNRRATGAAAEEAGLAGKRRVWLAATPDKAYELGFVDASIPLVVPRKAVAETLSGRTVSSQLVYAANNGVEADVTEMEHISEPCILHNVQERAEADQVYTWMGPVLVAVNPLKSIPEPFPAGAIDEAREGEPHPYTLAENVITRMQFFRNGNKTVSQSIVISGESGSGKTVTAKLLLGHIVKRLFVPLWGIAGEEAAEGVPLDRRLLDTNPILESFGNAMTLRNANSSRFGKFFRLHIDGDGFISGATVLTYLLERSRVSAHEVGERSFHVFYELLAGASKERKKALHLGSGRFQFLCGSSTDEDGAKRRSEARFRQHDATNYESLLRALRSVGVSSAEEDELFAIVAAIMHLGNVEVRPARGGAEGSEVVDLASARLAAQLLGLAKPAGLVALICERSIAVGKEVTRTRLSATQAEKARNALAKELYARLFLWIKERINRCVRPAVPDGGDGTNDKSEPEHFIGVLDIFGFESFERNDLEQLLINFANERLQASFSLHVLQAEADMYRKEGLMFASSLRDKGSAFADASLPGAPTGNALVTVGLVQRMLAMVDEEAKKIKPSDLALNARIHDQLAGERGFKAVHASIRKTCFTVVHFAGAVTYTVGSFLEKNDDSLPKEAAETMARSTNSIAKVLLGDPGPKSAPWQKQAAAASSSPSPSSAPKTSVSRKFVDQMEELADTLDSTNCSFVRCIKPNPLMQRVAPAAAAKASDGRGQGGDSARPGRPWFDRRYVVSQMKSLALTTTALALRDGMPLHLEVGEILDMFEPLIRGKVEKAFLTHGQSSPLRFASAALHAFEIPREQYRIGATKVFLRENAVDELERAKRLMREWTARGLSREGKKEKDAWGARFAGFLVRRRWKRAVLAVQFYYRMGRSTIILERQNDAVTVIQRAVRRMIARWHLLRFKRAAVMGQKLFRGGQGRARALAEIELIEERERQAIKATVAVRHDEADGEDDDEAARGSRMPRKTSKRTSGERRPHRNRGTSSNSGTSCSDNMSITHESSPRGNPSDRKEIATAIEGKTAEEIGSGGESGDTSTSNRRDNAAGKRQSAERVPEALGEPKFARVRKRSMAPKHLDTERFQQALEEVTLRGQEEETKLGKSYFDDEDPHLDRTGWSEAHPAEMDEDETEPEPTEEEIEAQTLTAVACKLTVRSRNAWKRRYFVLNKVDRTVSYFLQRGGKPNKKRSTTFSINPGDYNPRPEVLSSHLSPDMIGNETLLRCKSTSSFSSLSGMFSGTSSPGRFIIEIRGGKLSHDILREDRSLFIAFDTFEEMEQWQLGLLDTLRAGLEKPSKGQRNTLRRGEVGRATQQFGQQVRCRAPDCQALNNTLYGSTCLECGAFLLAKHQHRAAGASQKGHKQGGGGRQNGKKQR